MSKIENPLIDLEGLSAFKEEIEKEISVGNAALSDTLNVTKATGGIKSGVTYQADTPLETIFRDMLNPTENPTLTNPSATLSVNGSTLLETGSSVAKTFTVDFNRGSISPAYGTSGKRSGEATGYSLNGSESQSIKTFNETVTASNNTFKAIVSYAEGEQPKNSVGDNYSTPLPAGSVESNTITFEFVDAIWSNAANNSIIAKEALISKSAKTKTFVFDQQTATSPEVFDVPISWTINKLEVLNELNNKWEDCSSEFTITNTTHNDAGGNTVNYKRYADNRGYSAGSRSIRISFS